MRKNVFKVVITKNILSNIQIIIFGFIDKIKNLDTNKAYKKN